MQCSGGVSGNSLGSILVDFELLPARVGPGLPVLSMLAPGFVVVTSVIRQKAHA